MVVRGIRIAETRVRLSLGPPRHKRMAVKLEDITIREFSVQDLNKAQEYCDYINSLIGEDAKILINRKQTLGEEKEFVKKTLEAIKVNKEVVVVAV